MNRVTLQFNPNRPLTDSEFSVDTTSSQIIEKEDLGQGYIRLCLRQGRKLEISDEGIIRISTEIEDNFDIFELYSKSIEIIRDIIEKAQTEYSLVLVLNGSDSVEIYLEKEQNIKRFAEDRLESNNTLYNELGKNTIEISFLSDNPRTCVEIQ